MEGVLTQGLAGLQIRLETAIARIEALQRDAELATLDSTVRQLSLAGLRSVCKCVEFKILYKISSVFYIFLANVVACTVLTFLLVCCRCATSLASRLPCLS